jgi:hypothetical protein
MAAISPYSILKLQYKRSLDANKKLQDENYRLRIALKTALNNSPKYMRKTEDDIR